MTQRGSRWAALVVALLAYLVSAAPSAFADSSGYQVLPGGCGTGAQGSGAAVRPGTQTTTGLVCTSGTATLSGSTSNATSGVATSSTNVPVVSYNYGFNGTTWDQLQVDASKYLKIDCVTGCAGGATSNATSGVATSSTNGATVAWTYGFNGTTWDQLQTDGSKNLKVDIAAGGGGAVTIASAGVASGAYSSGSIASGAIASGAVASGAYASGSISDGAEVTVGTKADAATCATTNTLIACERQLHADLIAALPAGTNSIGAITGADPCFASLKSSASFESTTSGGSIVTAVSAKKTYVCSITIVSSTAANVSVIEGTGSSVCTGGTPSADYLNTSTTAANGASFAANGGVTLGSGNGTLFVNATANQNTCLLFTTTNTPQVNATVSYVQQ